MRIPEEMTTDPGWDYVSHWQIAARLTKQIDELRVFLANAEEASPEVDAELRRKFQRIQQECIRALDLLPEKRNE